MIIGNNPKKIDFEDVITILLNQNNPLDVGNILTLVKEPDNNYDAEAITVKLDDEKIGYVANSTNTVVKGTMSAGRIYDKINDLQQAEVILIDKNNILAKICNKVLQRELSITFWTRFFSLIYLFTLIGHSADIFSKE